MTTETIEYYDLEYDVYGDWVLTFRCDDRRRRAFIAAGQEKLEELEETFKEADRQERESADLLARARKEQERLARIYNLMTPEERARWNA